MSAVVDDVHICLTARVTSLSNLYNCIPRTSGLRLVACNALLALAVKHDDIDAIHLSLPDVERWLEEWNVSQEEKSTFLKTIANAYDSVHRPYVENYLIIL